MSATLSVLGAGSILPRVGYGCAGYALRSEPGGPVTLLDCGPGSVRALAGVGIELTEVRRVVLSHYHLDHCLDLFALAFARHNPTLASVGEIELVGPRGLRARIEGAPGVLGHWAAMPQAVLHEVEPGEELVREGLRWRCVANGHTPEALSWRVAGADWSLVYTGDTPEDGRVAELARDAGTFLAECSFPEEAATGRLILTHFYPSMDPEEARARAERVYDGELETAADGRVFELRGRP